MRKWLARAVAGVLACTSMLSIVGCGGGDDDFSDFLESVGGGGATEKVIDPTKTQLLVQNYTAGFGDQWLYDLETRFEEAYAGVSYEDGKMGVQVWHNGAMKDYTAQDVMEGSADIYFMEGASYYALTKTAGALEDLTDIVVNPNKDDNNTTILSKLTQQQKDFYGKTDTDGDAKYYAIPHYEGGWGLIYNKELFDTKGYYLSNPDSEGNCQLVGKDGAKGVGPDGVAGTTDDGLPRTYDEFFFLCDEIAVDGPTPICWSGQYREHYLTALLNTLVAEYCGIEQMELNLTFEGEAEDLIVLDENGKIVYENGQIKMEKKDITPANGYDLSRQAGKYYALQFLEKMMTTDGYCVKTNAFNSTHSHTAAQENFLKHGTKFSSGTKSYAMLVDGPWWEAEATAVYDLLGMQDSNFTKQNRDFAWMPLPKATEEKVGSKNVYIDTLNALTCVKAGLGPRKQAALDFVRFSATNESLVKFTQITGALKSYKYTLTEGEKSGLSSFAKSVIDYKNNSDLFVMNSGNDFYVTNASAFKLTNYYPGTTTFKNPVAAFNEKSMSAEAYFEAMAKYWSNTNIWA